MRYYLDFNELNCSIKEELVEFATEDYLNQYGIDDIEEIISDTELDYDDLLSLKVSEHMARVTIKIKL
ncbi:MAG TPA: hypothetical protein VK071_11050 [Tissierellales bacterium]|nr:hypothetical protein [Tissierellales bacterium]